jgi:uncharacterized protein DUF4262
MCVICSGLTEKEYWGWVRSKILQHGWFLQAIEADGPRNPAFAYTVGLSRWDHPELIAFGMHPCCAHAAVTPVASAVMEGQRFDEGSDLSGLYEFEEPVELLRFPDSSTHLYLANDMYRGAGKPPVPALQLLCPTEIPLLHGRPV